MLPGLSSDFGLSEATLRSAMSNAIGYAIKLLSALGRERNVRIRYANITLQQLD